MSRVFPGSDADYLQAPGSLGSDKAEATFFGWVKPADGTRSPWVGVSNTSNSSDRRYVGTNNGASLQYSMDGIQAGPAVVNGEWNFIAYLRREDPDFPGEFNKLVYANGVLASADDTDNGAGINIYGDKVYLGGSNAGDTFAVGKLAHAGILTRALTDAELLDLYNGGDPNNLPTTERYAYYPLTTTSLVNEWSADSTGSVGDLSVFGSVSLDTADDPEIGTPAISLSENLRPNTQFTINYVRFNAIPTSPVTLTDSNANSITVPVTITNTDNGDGTHQGTAVGTYPALPLSGSQGGLLFGSVTVALSEPDDVAPTLTNVTATSPSAGTIDATVDTDEGNGTLYYVATANSTETLATVKAGFSDSVTAAGTQSLVLNKAAGTYYVHFAQTDAAGNDSAVASSASVVVA